jgi:hypothetical protein
MASRTQLRLGQITGSFGTNGGQINDTLPVDAAANLGAIVLTSGSMVSVLSEMASAIKRINGGATFVGEDAGVLDNTSTKIGSAAGSGKDLFLYTAGTAAHVGVQWDADFATEGGLLGGVDDHGVDLKFFGETSGKFMHWDMSGDELVLASSSKLSFHDAAGDENIVASADGHLEVNAGTTLDMTAPTVDINASTAVTATTPSFVIDSATSDKPDVVIKNTNDDATGPSLALTLDTNNSAAANDVAGTITFNADDADDNQQVYGQIQTIASAVTAGSESGKITFGVACTDDGGVDTIMTLQGGAAAASSTVTIAGNLTVNGTTTTVDTTNLLVKDALITLNDGGGAGSAGGAGIEFEEDGGVTGFIKTASDRAGFEFQAPANSNTLTIDATASATLTVEGNANLNQDVTTDASVTFGDIVANGGVVVDNITIDGTEIDLSSGDLTVDVAGDIILDAAGADVRYKANGTEFGLVNLTTDFGLCLSSSADNDVTVDTQSGYFGINSKGTASVANGVIAIKNAGEVFFGNWNPAGGDAAAKVDKPGNLALKTGAISVLSASIGLQIDAGANAAALQLREAIGANFVALKSPDSLSGDLTLTLPTADGSSGHVLTTDGAGQLSFGAANAATKKCIRIITDANGLSAGTGVAVNGANPGDQISDLESVLATPNLLDVFVNGQLLMTGSEADVTAGSRDYRVTSNTALAFGFDLELDDIVQVIKRG